VEEGALGFAIATLTRSQLAGIGVGIALYFGEMFAAIFLPDVVKFLPFNAATAVVATTGGGGFGGGGANRGQANPAFAKYTACLKSHGVTFGSTSTSSSAFTKATAACKSLLPASTGGSANGGTTTTTP